MTTVAELIAQLQSAEPTARVVVSTREEYLGSLPSFGIETYIAGDDELSLDPGTVVLREGFEG